jgi:hypothetical protein
MDDALQKAIAQVLAANPAGLNERGIRQAVLKASRLRCRSPEIQAALQENPVVFISPWQMAAAGNNRPQSNARSQ